MNYAETLVLRNKLNQRNIKYNDLMSKITGKDKFETKNNYCEQNIQNVLNYLSPSRNRDKDSDTVLIRKKLWKNQQLILKR